MRLIHTTEGTHYRRWVNFIPSLIAPGSAQFLSGRRVAGMALFVSYLVLVAGMIAFLVHPASAYSVADMGPFDWFLFPFWLLIAGDSLRHPIPRLGIRGWSRFFAVCLGIPIILSLLVRGFLVQPFKIPTGAMHPTIMGNRTTADGRQISGDHVFVNKLSYRFSEPKRGDVIVFKTSGMPKLEQNTYYIKRLAGLPGETLGFDPPYLLVNDKRVMAPGIFKKIAESRDGFAGFYPAATTVAFPAPLASPSDRLTLGTDEYLVLGDNTGNSFDGRYFGPVKRSAIIGKAFYIYAPADRKHRIE